MCGRFSQQRPASELAEIFAAEPLVDEPAPRFTVAPPDEALVVVPRDARRAITAYRWGLIPHWAESAKVGSRMFNARAETLAASPAFREALGRKRCLVPADGFYEWQRLGSSRQPFLIGQADGAPLALAGLWSGWRDPAADAVVRSFTIITAAPNDQVRELHDRMPVIVPASAWDIWLDPTVDDRSELEAILQPNESVRLAIRPVSRLVNDVRNDGPELVEPVELVAARATEPGFFD
jgi:putative SOS response-associated peptidase YedK